MPQVLSTVIICLILAAALFFSVRKLWKDKKNGRSCCGGGCSGCSGCASCGPEKKKEEQP